MVKSLSQRKNIRFEIKSGVAMTPNGACRVTNLSKGGLAFTSFVELLFPPDWTMDIYDEAGLNLQGLKVRKVWEKKLNKVGLSPHFQVEVGWAFENLSSYQESQLSSYLMQQVNVKSNN